MALEAANKALAQYSHKKSPRKFTQPQLLACLIVKEIRKLDYRGIHIMLSEWSDLREVLKLKKIPHFTTLCTASKRLLKKKESGLLKDNSKLAAIDSTGIETRYASRYYTSRCERHSGHYKHRYPKLSAICDTSNHLILGIFIDRGPRLDHVEARDTLSNALEQQKFDILLGDAGYESEGFHRLCREPLGIESIIPTTRRGRPRDDGDINPVNGKYRQLMKELFPKELYGQRWQIETVFSILKRNLGSAVRSRIHYNQTREIRLRVLAHNLMILWRTILCFIQSRTVTYFCLTVFVFMYSISKLCQELDV
ncbi:MAG: IS5 family transposase [Sedimentisphaerales bacterium]|nr:IS5 family transposase [Sedimentisphaerales bacterium]